MTKKKNTPPSRSKTSNASSRKNELYFGDNLDILREHIAEDSVDLIYLDPPFNSKANYNVLFNEPSGKASKAQITAFEDTWHWTAESERTFQEIVHTGKPEVVALMEAMRQAVGKNDMLAYLTMMCIRLIELQRVLKPTGTIYLHCDPTASHYLKVLMDAIFEKKNFRNEIAWCYRGGGVPKKDFAKKHDIILRYSKTKDYPFYTDAVRIPYSPDSAERLKHKARSFRGDRVYDEYEQNPLGKHPEDWWPIQPIMPSSKERLSYPTQKPEQLLERIILASSKEGDVVLDPFCGCGTTTAVAERLKRRWVGIDITHLAINLIKWRLKTAYKSEAGRDYEVHGEPVDVAGAIALAQQDRHQFQWWATSLVGARPFGGKKKGADGGIDGYIYFMDGPESVEHAIVSVKSGKVSVKDIRDLNAVVTREGARFGVFITLEEPTKPMVREAVGTGFYKSQRWGNLPKCQITTIKELLEDKQPHLPLSGLVSPFAVAKEVKEEATQQMEL